ncbi:MAG: hypothetical protein JSV19_01630, partial [Phycisphaerales bacterium]
MSFKGVGAAAVVAGLLFASGTASGVQSKVYDWENGATILGMYPANTFAHTSVTSPVHGGLRSLKLEKIPDGSADTSQGYLAHITGLQDGDLITASFWIHDENTEGEDPRGRIWGHYTRGGIEGYAGSAGGNETYSAGPGWGLLSHSWTFDVGDLTQYDPRTGLVVEARVYGDDGQFMHFDDMTISAPDHARIHVPGEPMAYGRLTTTQVDTPVTVNLCYTTHFALQAVTITTLPDPAHGVLKDAGAPFSVPHDLTGALTFEPAASWSGVDTFSFQVTDTQAQTSAPATQEVAVQEDTVVISEVMLRPSSYQSTYEFIEIYNDSGENIYLTRLDSDVATDVLTDGNLVDEGTGPALVPPNSMKIIAIDNTAQYPDSFEEFRCDWGLNASDIILVDVTQWEYLSAQPASTCSEVNASRVLLFGKIGTSPDEVLLDAVDLGLVNSPAGSCNGASYALNQTDLTAYFPSDPAPNTANNDDVRVWKCSGDITAGRVYGAGTGDAGSPGYVPTHATSAYPYDPCVGACCLPDGTCLEAVVSAFCTLQCGTFHEDVACASAGCTAGDLHKCCLPNGECVDLYSSCQCLLYNGNWDSGTTCTVSPICFVSAAAVINELDYDNPGTDDVEFVEVYGTPLMDMTGWSLEFFDGSDEGNNLYRAVDLTGVSIPADGYLVIGSDLAPEVDAPLYTVLDTPPYTNLIQNGDPDGVVLLQSGTVVEALSYGGSFIARGGATGLLPLRSINATDTATGGLQKIPDASADGTTWVATTGQTAGKVNDFTGACCDNGDCSVLTEAECLALSRVYIGDDT